METQLKIKHGFTLIELLVVIAIIALLLAIILPSLQAAKELASGAVCVNNQKSLATSWVMYAEDYKGYLVGGSTYQTGRSSPYRWVEPPLLQPIYGSTPSPYPPTATSLTLQHRLNGFRAGKLFAYTGSEKVYHCPGDKTFRNPEPYAVNQSYAITGLMNGEHFGARQDNNEFKPIISYLQLNGKDLRVAIKKTDVQSPGSKLVFMEEDVVKSKPTNPQPYNRGSWVLLGGGKMAWWDTPAGYHNEGGTFSYADGHADKRKWRDKDTLAKIKGTPGYIDDAAEMESNEDIRWLAQGYIPIR